MGKVMHVQWIRKGENIGGGAELDWLATCNMNLVKNCHINTSEHFNSSIFQLNDVYLSDECYYTGNSIIH